MLCNLKLPPPKFFILTATTMICLLFTQCKKTEWMHAPDYWGRLQDTSNLIQQKFFNTDKISDPVILAIANNIQRQESQKPFLEKFVKYAGYPVWNKSIVSFYENASIDALTRTGKGKRGQIVFIPLALLNDSTVNAILKVQITPSDTTFKMIYRWQYKKNGYGKRDFVNNATQTALFFMGLVSRQSLFDGLNSYLCKKAIMIRYKVTLTEEERELLLSITKSGTHTSKKFIHALILLNCDEGPHSDKVPNKDVARILKIGERTIDRVKRRFVEEGFDAALANKPTTRVYNRKADGDVEAHLVALSCSPAPEGFTRWSLRLLAEKMVELQYVEDISHETVRRVLKKTNCSPGSKKVG